MKPYNPHREEVPQKMAYYDGEAFVCDETFCYIDDIHLGECGRIILDDAHETPILRCPECGKLYFGYIRRRRYAPPMTEKTPPPPPKPEQEKKPETKFEGIILPNLQTV